MSNKDLECVVSVSGFRGIVGQSMDPSVAMGLAAAYGHSLAGGGAVVLGRDSRESGPMFADAVAAGLAGVGCDVIDIGVVPTPTVPITMKKLRAAGGIQLSASHNPSEWNALKCFHKSGRNINQKQLATLLKAYEAAPNWQAWDGLGGRTTECGALEWHLQRVLDAVDVDLIRQAAFTVVIDSVNGAGSSLGPRLLDALGCRVIPLYNDPNRPFPRDPEPTADNVTETGKVVASVGAAIGFVQDPDADRLALIDGKGRYIGEEYTLVLCAGARLAAAKLAGNRKPVACTNLSTSRMIDDVAARVGGRVQRTAVGEANVVDGMLAEKAVIGGEGNGGIIDPRVVLGRDSHIGMALVLEHLARQEQDLLGAVAEIPSYAMLKTKLPLDKQQVISAAAELREHKLAKGSRCDESDGLKLSWEDRWVHLRASGTEPVSRLICEAPTPAVARGLVRDVCRVLKSTPLQGH